MVCSVCLVYLVSFVQRKNQTNQTDQQVFLSISLVPHPSGELRKEFPREVVGIGRVDGIFAAKIVVEDSSVGGFVDVGQVEVHVVAFDGASYATDEDYGAIRLLPLHNSNVCQRVVYLAVTVVVPCIVEEDEIAWVGDRSLVERALLLYVRIDEADAICFRIALAAAVQIDPVSEKNYTGHPRAIISYAPTVALNRFGAHEFGRCPHNRAPARRWLDGSTTGALYR